jgi:hypothetical protein
VKTRIMLIAGAAAAVAVAGPASALVASPTLSTSLVTPKAAADGSNGSDNGIHDTKQTDRFNCNEEGTQWIEYRGPDEIWPPNHKMRDYAIVAHDDDGGTVTLATITMSSQVANGPGDGNTDTDFVDTTPAGADSGEGEATNTGQVRGERSGTIKEGRTYTFDSTATFSSDMSECSHQFSAHVPHDQSGHENKKPSAKKRSAKKRLARR